MLKRTVLSVLVVAMASLVGLASAADRGEARVTITGKDVAVEYGRPSLAGRDMLGKAEVGTPWRLGSGSPTTLKTDLDLHFGSVTVAKGTYVLKAIKRAADKWDLVLTPQVEGAKAVELPLAVGTVKESVETLTISLPEAKAGHAMVVAWATTTLTAEFSAK
jgi:hypothetical protein